MIEQVLQVPMNGLEQGVSTIRVLKKVAMNVWMKKKQLKVGVEYR